MGDFQEVLGKIGDKFYFSTRPDGRGSQKSSFFCRGERSDEKASSFYLEDNKQYK